MTLGLAQESVVATKHNNKECVDPKQTLLKEFHLVDFDQRFMVGGSQTDPLKEKILSVLKNPDYQVSDIEILIMTPKTPHFKKVKDKLGREKTEIDPESSKKNLQLVRDRSEFVAKMLKEFKLPFEAKAVVTGPEFDKKDLNLRFVTRMTPSFLDQLEAIYRDNEKIFKEDALVESWADLIKPEYSNLYLAKFNPFLGFKVKVSGYKKSELKCLDKSVPSGSSVNPSSKQ